MNKQPQEQKVNCPFIDSDGQVHSPFRAILDRCIIWPTPPPEKIGSGVIEIPQTIRAQFQDSTGILLSVGPGYWGKETEGTMDFVKRPRLKRSDLENKRPMWHPTTDQLKPGIRVYYDNSVPWWVVGKDQNGKEHALVICGVMDIQGIVS